MKEPRWITPAVIHAMHEELLARFGGLSGVRDEGMLASALGSPKKSFAYKGSSLYEQAADYAVGIVKNHPFVDGNKRTGFMAAYVFLLANGKNFSTTEEAVVLQTLSLAAGEISGAEYALWLEDSCE
ncbi:Toxin Doc [Pontiella desulfatans]|uniref:Toxin Doc n=1 Tax=Pontiella desulfatans TaxID=2750659 RepID=A0A6C2TW99_PONDE|nr:type II toxin-antitoxin system death-on-curing family toxin [Pontiella desulfatans]VGO11606.1 Toxin Doc [Pontiella desulfatans]